MPRHVPIEIYALIFQHVTSNDDLSNLCMVSRTFRHEAQRILYHTVRLPIYYDRLISWFQVIAENPRLAVEVYALFLPMTFRCGSLLATERDSMLQTVQQAVKRALSSLSRLVELHTFAPLGTVYLNVNLLCGHPFRLQVFEEWLPKSNLEYWLKFLSDQPEIRHWRTHISRGHAIGPYVLPSLTSAHVSSSALDIITHSPMIRALRVMKWSSQYSNELMGLKAFRSTLTTLSLEYLGHFMEELEVVRDAVPNIKFLGLRPLCGSQMFHPLADLLSRLSGFAHLTTLVFELPHGTKSPIGWPTDSREALSLVAGLMNANPTFRRVAFEMRGSCQWTNGRWPCYIRAPTGSDSNGDNTAVFEGFDILGPDSWRNACN